MFTLLNRPLQRMLHLYLSISLYIYIALTYLLFLIFFFNDCYLKNNPLCAITIGSLILFSGQCFVYTYHFFRFEIKYTIYPMTFLYIINDTLTIYIYDRGDVSERVCMCRIFFLICEQSLIPNLLVLEA